MKEYRIYIVTGCSLVEATFIGNLQGCTSRSCNVIFTMGYNDQLGLKNAWALVLDLNENPCSICNLINIYQVILFSKYFQ